MEAGYLKKKIANDLVVISEAKECYLAAVQEFEAIKNPINKEHQTLLLKFRDLINSGIEKLPHCDCCTRYFSQAAFTKDGIAMRIDADHPNDIIDQQWDWDAVEMILEGKAAPCAAQEFPTRLGRRGEENHD